MHDLLDDLSGWLAAGEPVALATVVWAEGPSPRPVGAHMAVTPSGGMVGSVSGGCVEGAVFQEAGTVLESGAPKLLRYGVVDEMGWEVGLACGGTIEVYVERLAPVHERLLAALAADETVALVTPLRGGAHLLAWPDGRLEGDASLAALLGWDVDSRWPGPLAERRGAGFVQVYAPPPTLTIVGAVHLAQPLTHLAQAAGFRVRVLDARRAFATRERFPTADELVVAWPQEGLTLAHLRPQDALAVITHDPKFDVPALAAALRSPVGYVGLLGSRTTQAKRRGALVEQGFGEADLARIRGPIGLDLGGRRPEEIAVAILAQIVAARYGRADDGWRRA